MKKVLFMLVLLLGAFTLTACGSNDENKVVKATLDEHGDIVINKDDITEKATYVSYEVDGVTISFIAVRGTDGKVRVAFNTCQACSPSPNAYFVQKGGYFECQNCGNRFGINKIGEAKGGCNPAPVEEKEEDDQKITISSEYAKTFKEKFENWDGPKA